MDSVALAVTSESPQARRKNYRHEGKTTGGVSRVGHPACRERSSSRCCGLWDLLSKRFSGCLLGTSGARSLWERSRPRCNVGSYGEKIAGPLAYCLVPAFIVRLLPSVTGRTDDRSRRVLRPSGVNRSTEV